MWMHWRLYGGFGVEHLTNSVHQHVKRVGSILLWLWPDSCTWGREDMGGSSEGARKGGAEGARESGRDGKRDRVRDGIRSEGVIFPMRSAPLCLSCGETG